MSSDNPTHGPTPDEALFELIDRIRKLVHIIAWFVGGLTIVVLLAGLIFSLG